MVTHPPFPTPPICNIAQAKFSPLPGYPPLFGGERWNVAGVLRSQQLGISLVRIPPGKAAFPFHNHYAVEEIFYIIEGNGHFIYGDDPRPKTIAAGDIIVCRAGGVETAHQIRNRHRTKSLLYLGVSTKSVVDYVEHPKSQKFCIWVYPSHRLIIPHNPVGRRYYCGRNSSALSYFTDEPTDPLEGSDSLEDNLAESSRAVLNSSRTEEAPSGDNIEEIEISGVRTPGKSEWGDPYFDYRGPPPEYKPPDNPPAFDPWAFNHKRDIQFCLDLLATYPADERIRKRLSEAYAAGRDIDQTIEGWKSLILKHVSSVVILTRLFRFFLLVILSELYY